MRNGPNTKPTLDLPINSDVCIWREKGGWKGPYKLLATDGETCTVAMPHGPANFHSTVVKPYYTEEAPDDDQPHDDTAPTTGNTEPTTGNEQVQYHGRGQPLGSGNKTWPVITICKGSRNRKCPIDKDFEEQFITAISEGIETSIAFITSKEQADMELSMKLRQEGIITTPGKPFEKSQQ
jgi:hypothetical protein